MKKAIFNKDHIFPVIYDEGILFQNIKNLNHYYLWKDNKIKSINIDELKEKEIHYPETIEENLQLNQAIDIIFNRIQNGELIEPHFVDTILFIKKRQEYLKKEILRAGLE